MDQLVLYFMCVQRKSFLVPIVEGSVKLLIIKSTIGKSEQMSLNFGFLVICTSEKGTLQKKTYNIFWIKIDA